MNRFNQVQLDFTTVIPALDPLAQVLTICDPQSGDIVGINKPTWRIYELQLQSVYHGRTNQYGNICGWKRWFDVCYVVLPPL